MYVFKPPRPIGDYYIGKYHKGDCIYLITKEAYTNWKNQQVSVKHNVCLPEGETQYSLKPNADYVAHRYENRPKEWDKIILRDCPYLIDAFVKVKSEPAPDQYYILYRGENQEYHIALRSDLDLSSKNRSAHFVGPKWQDRQDSTWTHSSIFIHGTEKSQNTWYKKFPQLSSEVKAELQKLNPERYKEWEDFYMKKYPNMQPLKPMGIRLSIDSISLLTFIAIQPPYDELYGSYKFKGAGWGLISKDNWVDGDKDIHFTHWKSGDIYWVKREHLGHGPTSWNSLGDNHHKFLKENNSLMYTKFKQYYAELEQKKVAEKQYSKYGDYYEIPMEDFEVLSYNGNTPYLLLKSDRAKLGSTENCIVIDLQTLMPGWNSPYLANPYSYKPSQKYLYVHERWYNLPHISNELMEIWDHSSGSEDWTTKIRKYPKATFNKPQTGSDLDIDQQALEKGWTDLKLELEMDKWKKLQAATYQEIQNLTGISNERANGKRASFIIHEEAGKMPKWGIGRDRLTGQFLMGFDPYQPSAEDQGCISVWGKDLHGKLVNRLIELEGEQAYKDFADWYKAQTRKFTPAEYYDMLMNSPSTEIQGVAWIKPRRAGQAHYNDQMQAYQMALYAEKQTKYSPNIKQQNDEIINVPRKTITITSGQEYSRSIISSYRCAPTVTAEHTQYGQEPCRGREIPGGCKIS